MESISTLISPAWKGNIKSDLVIGHRENNCAEFTKGKYYVYVKLGNIYLTLLTL